MIDTAFRAAFLFLLVYMGFGFSRHVRSGVLQIGDDEPFEIIRREERPFAFWSFVAFFYTILAVMFAAAILPPSDGAGF
jgi:hypothetical protein